MKKVLFTALLLILLLTLCGSFLCAAADDVEELLITEGPEDGYSYADGILTIKKDGEYTVSMAEGVEQSSHRIVVKYDADTCTKVSLTLNSVNLKIEGDEDDVDYADDYTIYVPLFVDYSANTSGHLDLELKIKGENSIDAPRRPMSGTYASTDVTISSVSGSNEDSLTLSTSLEPDGFNECDFRNLTLNSGTVNAVNCCMMCAGDASINGGMFTSSGEIDFAFYIYDHYSEKYFSNYLQSGGTVNISASCDYAIYIIGREADEGEEFPENEIAEMRSEISGGELKISNCIAGIFSGNDGKQDFIVSGGKVTMEDVSYGLVTNMGSSFELQGGTVNLTAGKNGLRPQNPADTISISGGEIEISSVEEAIYLNNSDTKVISFAENYNHKNYDGTSQSNREEVADDALINNGASDKYVLITPAWNVTYDLGAGALGEGVTNPDKYTRIDEFTFNDPTPADSNFVFNGWTGTDLTEATTPVTIAAGSSGDRSYTAEYSKINHAMVTFTVKNGSWNDGTQEDIVINYTSEEGVDMLLTDEQIPQAGEKPSSGYKAGSWDTLPQAQTLNDGDELVFTYTYAQKSSGGGGGGGGNTIKYQLGYESNGGTAYKSESYASGTVVKLDKTPIREGYSFTGWYNDSSLSSSVTKVTMDKNQIVYAGWEKTNPGGDSILNSDQHIGYIKGYADGTVHPDGKITRAETTTILYRLLTAEQRDRVFTADNGFNDVTKELWYNKAVSSMANGGFVQGYPDGSFGGNRNITRAEFVAMVARMIEPATGENNFHDVNDSHWASDYIAAATGAGWVEGYEDGSFRPDQTITRAEAVTIINRILDRGVNVSSNLGDYYNPSDNADENAWYYYEIIEACNDHEQTGSRPSENWTSNSIQYFYDIDKYERP